MNELEREEARIARLLGAVRAEADPAVLTRARARIAASAEVPRVFAWLGTPAALVTACALLVASAGVSFTVLNGETSSTHDTTLIAALIGDDGTYGIPTTATTATDVSVTDSGGVTQ